MGLREKVTITLVIIALIQIACRHCMPRTPRKVSLKRYLNDLKPVKNNPISTPYSPSRVNKTPKKTFGKTAQNGRVRQNCLPNKSLHQTYNFPENEYPLDNSPRDPFRIGMNFNENNYVNTLQKARYLQSSAISDFKKEIKMKRKLLSNKQVNNENSQLKTDILSSIKSSSNQNPILLLDSETFPEVQYPLNTMDTWGPNYWNYLPFTQEKPYQRFEQQIFNLKDKEDINEPFTRLTKAKASKYLQSYDKLKEKHRRTSTENSKRSNVGQKGLNFTKTATCERVSDDFITAGLVSNILSNSTEMEKALTSSANITTSSKNTCPVTEYPYHPMPIPYKIIEENTENIYPSDEPINITKELQDVDNNVIAQTLQLTQEILVNDDTSSTVLPINCSKEIEKNMNTSDYTVVSANEDISTTLTESVKSCTVSPIEELSQQVSDDVPAGNLRNNMTSLQAELIPENTTTAAGPLNVRMPLPFSEPITYEALTNALNSGPTPLLNGNAFPGSTSIIIIPFNNNAVDKSQSDMFGTTPDTQIIVYLPSTQSSNNLSQPSPFNQIVSSSIDRPVPNNQLYNVLSNMAPLQNDNLFSTALVSELLNSNSDSGSSLPIHETLPTNSICYNNESSLSSMRVKPISDIFIDKSLTDDVPIVTTTWDEKLSEKPTKTDDLDVKTNTLPPISDFEHPLFDFYGSEFTSLSHGPYNNVLNNELPITAREIDSDQEISNVSSKDLLQNTTSEQLHKTISMDSISEDSLSEIPNDVLQVGLDKNFSSVTYLQEPVDRRTESPPQSIDKILLSTLLIETPTTEQLLPTDASLISTPLSETLSDKVPETIDVKLSTTLVSDTITDSTPQHIRNSPSPPILNSSPVMTDMTLKTELYKMRQILDKMLSTETSAYSPPPHKDTTLLPISETDNLLLLMNEMPTENLPLPATDSPIDSLRQLHETLPLISVDGTPTDTLPLPGHKLVSKKKVLETDTPSLPIDEIVSPTLVSEFSADNKPYVLDNLVTPQSETVILRTKDPLDNGLSHKMDDSPFKMELKFPDIYEVCSGDLLLSVDDLPTELHPEYTTINPGVSKKDLPAPVVETLTPVSELPVRDLPKPIDVFSLPDDEVLEGALDVLTDSVKTLMSGSNDKLLQDFPSSKVPSDDLPPLPMNDFKLSIHETFSDGQFNKISSKGPPQKNYLPLSVQKLIPNLSSSDAFTNETSSKDYLPSFFVIDKNIEFPYSTGDNKDLPQVVEHLLSPENDAILDSLVTDIPSAVSLSMNLKRLQSTNKASDEVLSESTLSDLPRDDLSLPEDKMLSLTDNTSNYLSLPINITSSTTKLPIAQALLENILSDIKRGGLSSLLAKDLPVIQHSPLDKTIHYVDVKSPLSETKDIPLRHTDNLIDYVPFYKKTGIASIMDLPSEMPSSMHEMHKVKPYIPTIDVKHYNINETQSLDNPTHDLPVTIDKVSSPKDTTKTPSSSKLPLTKALLENVLTDITTRSFSVPVAQSLPVTSPSVIEKTLYFVESPISHIIENSLPVYKILPNTSLSGHPTGNLPISTEDTLPLPIDKTFLELQSLDIPTELSSPLDNIRQDIPIISLYDKEQDEIEIPSSENLTDDPSSASPMKGILSFSKDTPSDLTFPNNKTPSSSKLPLTKALLENILADITTKGFSVPVAQSLPITSSSALDKTILSHIIENSSSLPVAKIPPNTSLSDHPTDNLPISTENTLPLPIDKTFLELQSLDIPTELSSPLYNIRQDIPIITKYDKEQDKIENPYSENLTDDASSASPMKGILSFSKDTPSDLTLPNIKIPSSSKLPLTKALLENVLTDLTTRGFSVPVAQSAPVTSPSVLDKTLYYAKSPISHYNKNSPSLPVDKILPNTSLSDHPTDNLPISTEDTLPLPINKTFSELQNLDMPTELSSPLDSIRQDIPIISLYDKEQDEIENSSSENLTDDPSSASPMKGILSFSKDTASNITIPNNKTPSSSKLPLTKALLENILADITTKGFSVPVAQSLPITSSSALNKTIISHIIENSASLPVDKIPPNTSLSDHLTDNLPISTENTLPLRIDKTFLELQSLDIPTEMSSPVDDIRQDIPFISMYDKEQDEIENPSSENFIDDLSLVSPMEGIPSLLKDTPSDLTLPKIKTPSSSKLPLTKALLENILADVTTKDFSKPVAQSLPIIPSSALDKTIISHIIENSPSVPIDKIPPNTSLSDHPTDNLPISTKDTLPLLMDKKKTELQSLDVLTVLSSPVDNIRQDIPIISMNDKEQDEIENPSSENFIDDLSSASPMEGIPSLPKETPSDLTLPNIKTPSSSKLPLTKALLENILTDITTRGFSVPVAQSLPVIPPSVLDKTLYYVESPIPHITENSPLLPVDKILLNISFSDHPPDNSQISTEDNLPLPIDKTFSELQSLDVPTGLSSPIDNIRQDTPIITMYDKEQDEIENPYSENLTDGLSLASPMEGMLSISKDTPSDLALPNIKTQSSSKLPITKALLENVLTDITIKGFSVPVAQSPSVTSPSMLDKTLYYAESPISHINENSPSLPVDKILPNRSLSDHPPDSLSNSTEDTLPLPIDKTFSELQSLDVHTELSSPIDNTRQDIPIITMYDKEQDEIENPYFENLTDDLSLASPMEGMLSISKDTPSDLALPNIKTLSSSKLPITKALLENVLTHITTKGFSVPVAQSLPVISPSVLDKILYYVESPISHITENSPSLPVDKIIPNISLSDHPTDNLPISTEDNLPLPIDKTFSELQSYMLTELSSPIDNIRQDIPIITMYEKEQDDIENLSSENLTDDLSSASPMEGILSLSKDTPSDLALPNIKTPLSSKLSITKTLLENVLSDINTRGFMFPIAKVLPVAPRSQLHKTLYFLESPVSGMTEKSSVIPTDNFPSSGINEDVPDNPILDIPTDKLLLDKIHNSVILTDDLEQEDKPDHLTDNVEDRDKTDILKDDVEQEDKSDILTDDVEDEDQAKSDILTDDVEGRDISDILTDDIGIEDSNVSLFLDDFTDDMPSELPLPRTKLYLSSRIPITKALFEKILSDITDGSIHP